MTIADAIRAAADRLFATSDTARLDAELLMAHVLRVSRSDMLLRHMRDEAAPHLASFDALVARRTAHEPIAYILGRQEFFGHEFAVMPGVLIPRGDSETLVRAALEMAPDARRVLDMGTGSGALLISSLLANTGAQGIGIDASETAALVASANASAHGLSGRAQILRRSWRDEGWADDLGQFDLILCNPPYVESNAVLDPDVCDHEPAEALFSGPEGLDDYRVIIPQLGKLLFSGGVAIFEIGHLQAAQVSDIARESGFTVEVLHDLGGRDRALVLT